MSMREEYPTTRNSLNYLALRTYSCRALHAALTIEFVAQVMTSFHPEGVEDHLLVIASTTVPQDDGLPCRLRLKIPRSGAYFTGTGAESISV